MRVLGLLLAATMAAPGLAQEPALGLELNALDPADGGCRITFLATNTLGTEISRAGLEVALFGADGGIDRLVALDLKALTPGKTKVLQFRLADLDCTEVTRVLVNDVSACDGEGTTPAGCLAALRTTNRTSVAFGL